MASSFETHRFAMLLKDEVFFLDEVPDPHGEEPRLRGVSNHEATGDATTIRANRKTL